MTKWMKIPLGLAALAGGGALFISSGAALADSMLVTRSGFALGNLFFFAAGLIGIGAAADCLGPPRKPVRKKKPLRSRSGRLARMWINGALEKADMRAQTDKGIYLGNFAGEGADTAPVRLRYKRPKHALCIAPPGAGKSMGIAVEQAHLPRSQIWIDPKGQNTVITYRQRAALSRRPPTVLNPFGMFPELPHLKDCGWNPLRQLKPRSPDWAGDARCIADAIISKSTGGGNNANFFEISAQNLLALFVMAESLKERPDLNNIRLQLSSPTLPQILERMAQSDALPVRVAAGRLFTRLSDTNTQNTAINDIIETVLKDMAFLDDPRLAFSMARGSAIEWGALHREITTIYLILPVHELTGNGAKLLRLFVNLALRGLYQNPPTGGATLPPILALIDEFPALGRLEEVIKANGAARDYSIHPFFFAKPFAIEGAL
jgi:type IV secretory pathway TraG/TraD family ATPase VirD4